MILSWNDSLLFDDNFTDRILLNQTILNTTIDDNSILYPLTLVIPITIVYSIIFITGVVGNVSTCIVIYRNKSMHTATNYYLFSLAISDMLLLISGLPPEMSSIWSPETYVFGEIFCVLQGFAAETSANATVLTITAFTVERYLAICHPFLSHTMSKLSRAIRYIIAIWIIALCLSVPQAIQFHVEYENLNETQYSRCTVKSDNFFQYAFEISTFLFFVGPMTLITVLYVLIAVQLRKSKKILVPKRASFTGSGGNNEPGDRMSRNSAAQNRVVKMLVAVVAAFFICWAPFHAQRLLAVYLHNSSEKAQPSTVITLYMVLMHTSGILYFLSTTINPLLYNIMSNKFREAFKKTFSEAFCSKDRHATVRTYSVLSRYAPSVRNFQRSVSDGVQLHHNDELILKSAEKKHSHFLGGNKTKQHSLDEIIKLKNGRTRVPSESSQTTVLTTLSKVTSLKDDNNLNNKALIDKNNAEKRNRRLGDVRSSPHYNDKYLYAIRRKMLKMFQKQNNHFNNHFNRQSSVESTNTISNSSLQDMDEMEFSSSDLVRYMEEINEDLT